LRYATVDNYPTRLRAARRRNAVFTLLVLVFGACVLVGGLAGGALVGAQQGANDLRATDIARVRAESDLQYQQALADMDAGNYVRAYERLWAVINLNPAYPGAQEAYDRVIWILQNPPTPTQTPTPMPTLNPTERAPTPLVDAEGLFAQAQTASQAEDWQTVIELLDALMGPAPDYRQDEVKGMLFEALVELGMQRLNEDRLEEGINLIDRASIYGELPPLAYSGRNLAADYMRAIGFWGADWEAAIEELRALYIAVPEYRDVQQSLYRAYVEYADSYVERGDFCPAVPLYRAALGVIYDGEVEGKRADAASGCASATPTPTPTVEPTVIPGAVGITVYNLANLRQGPSQQYATLETLGAGALLSAIGRNAAGDWLFVVTPSGARGWVFVEVVNTELIDVSTLPVTEELGGTTTPTP
jgi:tetratricopeptide (TPR) repeat protein